MKKLLLLILSFLSLNVLAQDMDTALYNSIERYHAQKNARFNGYYKGIDVSKYQHEIEWNSLDTTLHFIICKATEGTTLVDKKFKQNWQQIDDRYKKGAYHFFRPDKPGKEQAQLFLKTVNFDCGHILPIIDVEYTRGYRRTNPRIMAANLHKFIAEIELQLGVKPIIYTNGKFWEKYINPYFKYKESDFQLWIADYRQRENPGIHKDWQDWTMWQHSAKGCVDGINCEVDLNVCKKPLEEIIIK